jgi:hypothetical protein
MGVRENKTNYLRSLTFVLGSFFIIIWTLLRFFNQRLIYDQVSQQVVVHQWLHGQFTPVTLGMTAYVPKMLLLYMPVDLLPGSPIVKLIGMTVLMNLITFLLICWLAEKILREFTIELRPSLYAGLVWLSALAGSVFWIAFANSRNLEVAGGLFWVYGLLRLTRTGHWQWVVGLGAFGSLLFFDDPLQLYMCGAPMLLYGFVLAFGKRLSWRTFAGLIAVTMASYIGSKLLFSIAGHWLKVSFTATGAAGVQGLSVNWLAHSVIGSVKAIAALYAGATDAGKLREFINLAALLTILALVVRAAVHRAIPRRLIVLFISFIATDLAVYIASGEAMQGSATDRYLILLAPLAVLALGSVPIKQSIATYLKPVFAIWTAINLFALTGSLVGHWNTSFPVNDHLASAYRYETSHPAVSLYASIDTSLPTLYLHKLPADRMLPVGCLRGSLVATHYSMDEAFHNASRQTTKLTAVILDGRTITNTPNVCSDANIRAQFGSPLATDTLDDGSLVLLYRQAVVVP